MKGRSLIPELPEVETVRRELEPWLNQRQILKAGLVDAKPGPKYAELERAIGQKILGVNRRGKFLLLRLDGGDELVIHLGMTGIISPKEPQKHVRVALELSGEGNTRLYFQDVRRFGRFLVVKAGDYQSLPTLKTLGVEPLSEDFKPLDFWQTLQASKMPIKSYLLSQRPVAGVEIFTLMKLCGWLRFTP
ncbi:MAG: DNA-formamidopyrimidine glycosylase family protein [Deinococcales bacterium]